MKHIHLAILSCLIYAGILGAQGIVVDENTGRTPLRGRTDVEIEKHDVRVTVENGAAKTTLTQVFRSSAAVDIEGTYLFPLDDAASITDFTMTMNGQVVRGEVLERDKAREIYEGIVRRRQDPALLEYVGSRLFQARVFPIPARGRVEISLSYVEQLRRENGTLEYRYPLKSRVYSQSPVDQVSVRVQIRESAAIRSVFSSSHLIEKTISNDQLVEVAFNQRGLVAERDFQLYWTVSREDLGIHVLSEWLPNDSAGYFMLTLAPANEPSADNILGRDVVFVVDTSGSMRENEKFRQALAALKYGVETLREQDRFGILAFSTEVRSFSENLVSASPAEKSRAVNFVNSLTANGGTNISDALKKGLSLFTNDSNRLPMVVFLTDGTPTVGETDTTRILDATLKGNSVKARFYVFGVGNDVHAEFLDRLAEHHRGTRDYVTPAQNLELVLAGFFDKVMSPVVTDIVIQVEAAEVEDVYPKVLPDVFKGSEITIFGRYRKPGNSLVRARGMVNGRPRDFVQEVRLVDQPARRDFLPTLWARRKTAFLLEQIRISGFNTELKEEIVRLGKMYGLATPYTSFLVLEDTPVAQGSHRRGTDSVPAPGHSGARDRLDDTREARKSQGLVDGLRAGGGELADLPAEGEAAVEVSRSILSLKSESKGPLSSAPNLDGKGREQGAQVKVERINGKSFVERAGVWTDLDTDKLLAWGSAVRTSIVLFSKEYFELLNSNPELRAILARLPRLVLEWKGTIYEFSAPPVERAG